MSIHPKLEALPDRGKHGETLWRVLEDVRVKVAPRMYVEVPAGYVSNLGTIPRYLRWFVAPSDFPGPFVLHDYMVNEDHIDDGEHPSSGYSRWISDAVLYEMLVRHKPNISAYRRYLIWVAVRLSARSQGLV